MKNTKEYWVLSVLSDAQEQLSWAGTKKDVNETINNAKKILVGKYIDIEDGFMVETTDKIPEDKKNCLYCYTSRDICNSHCSYGRNKDILTELFNAIDLLIRSNYSYLEVNDPIALEQAKTAINNLTKMDRRFEQKLRPKTKDGKLMFVIYEDDSKNSVRVLEKNGEYSSPIHQASSAFDFFEEETEWHPEVIEYLKNNRDRI